MGPSPPSRCETAILATDQSWQDAAATVVDELLRASADPLDANGQPWAADAQTGLLDLGIQQVIEPGGPVAISNTVNASLEGQGIDVIRLAGQDASDTSTQIARFELNGQPNQFSGPNTGGFGTLRQGGPHPARLGWRRFNTDCPTTQEFTPAPVQGRHDHRVHRYV